MIRIGRLLPGGMAIGSGQHNPLKGIAELPTEDGATEEVVVFAKQLSSRSISTEITCAVLGRCLSLPIPEPVILFDSSNAIYFGSVEVAYPSFSQYINDSSDVGVSEELASWPLLRQAAFFDEWIAMDDRHNGNLLFNGEVFYLIDHESAIPSRLAPEQVGLDYYSNQLLQIADFLIDRTNEVAVQQAANEGRAWAVSNREKPLQALDATLADSIQEKTKNQMISFLAARIEVLGDILYDYIKPKQAQMNYDAQP
ncbi:hypothetical protein [Rouxiella badensis]|uniref:hypothetical protein n=1 Tax=Rouxiella badensis TaxID=1646377 RepID=UPI00301CD82D